jgi:hypothetical protein
MGESAQLSFAPKIPGEFFDLGKIFSIQQILRLKNGRNSPKSEEIHPFRPKKYLLCSILVSRNKTKYSGF